MNVTGWLAERDRIARLPRFVMDRDSLAVRIVRAAGFNPDGYGYYNDGRPGYAYRETPAGTIVIGSWDGPGFPDDIMSPEWAGQFYPGDDFANGDTDGMVPVSPDPAPDADGHTLPVLLMYIARRFPDMGPGFAGAEI